MMQKFLLIDVNVFSLIISFIILLDLNTKFDRQFLQNRLFRYMIYSNIALILLDTAGRLVDGSAVDANIAANYIFCYLFYILEPMPFFLWVLYVELQIYHNEPKLKSNYIIYLIPYFLFLAMIITNPLTHGVFYINEAGFYKRGFLIPVISTICFLYGIYVYVLLIRQHKKIERRTFNALMIFAVPPLLGGFVQTIMSGHSFLWPAVTLSILIIYVNIQNNHISTDYLTGVYNRREADGYIKSRIDSDAAFSGILIDVDKFKDINDRFGHLTGDDALENVAQAIKKILHRGDFIARYGGDEFLVIINSADRERLEKTALDIHKAVKELNSQKTKPYSCTLSLGYAVFNKDQFKNEDQFIREIDRIMYENKNAKSKL